MEQSVKYCHTITYKEIEEPLYNKLNKLGLIPNDVRKGNVGASNYSKYTIQPWSIWIDYNLNPWDADIVKRILRTKTEPGLSEKEARLLDYNKIIHICKERIRQLESEPEITYITSSVTIPKQAQEAATTNLKSEESDFSITYTLKNSELTAFKNFQEYHKNCSGNVQVCFSNECSIGHNVKVYCPDCGTEEDITDVKSW